MKKTIWIIVGALALIASFGMYFVGQGSSHLDELLSFWFYPLPVAIIAFIAAFSGKKQQ